MQDYISQPPITGTCRVIREELLRYFYESNKFVFVNHGKCVEVFVKWFTAIGLRRMKWMKEIYIKSGKSDVLDIFISKRIEDADVEGNKSIEAQDYARLYILEATSQEVSDFHFELEEDRDLYRVKLVVEVEGY